MKTKHWQTAILLAVAFAADAAAAEYPARPIRFIVPYGGGSGPDITARLFATELSTIRPAYRCRRFFARLSRVI